MRKFSFATILVAACLLVGTVQEAYAQEESSGDEELERSDCDRFIEAYVRSSVRKIQRALSRGEYRLRPVGLEDPLTLTVETSQGEKAVTFEVVTEDDEIVVGLVDRRREWLQTYVVASAGFGPIIISQTWQARHLRDAGQACEPIYSNVEWPSLTASTVDMEPFDFWGVRVVWRVPWPDMAESTQRSVEDVLRQIMSASLDE